MSRSRYRIYQGESFLASTHTHADAHKKAKMFSEDGSEVHISLDGEVTYRYQGGVLLNPPEPKPAPEKVIPLRSRATQPTPTPRKIVIRRKS